MAVLIHERPEGELVVRCLQPLLCHRRSLDVPVPRRETPYPPDPFRRRGRRRPPPAGLRVSPPARFDVQCLHGVPVAAPVSARGSPRTPGAGTVRRLVTLGRKAARRAAGDPPV